MDITVVEWFGNDWTLLNGSIYHDIHGRLDRNDRMNRIPYMCEYQWRLRLQNGLELHRLVWWRFNRPKQRTLNYISGFGPQKSIQLRWLIFGKCYPTIDSRSKLKDYLDENIFQNSIGFLRIHSNSMDDSRIHPNLYDLAKDNSSIDR